MKRITILKPWYWMLLMFLMFSFSNLIAAMISGQVLDINLNPISQSQVSLMPLGCGNENPPEPENGLTTYTDSNGNYVFSNVTIGSYHVRAFKDGYFPGAYNDGNNPNISVVEVDADDQEVVYVNIQLLSFPTPQFGSVFGSVVNAEDNDQYFMGVKVALVNPNNENAPLFDSIKPVNYNGDFFINHIEYGDYKVIAFYDYPFELLAISEQFTLTQQNPVLDSLLLVLNNSIGGISVSGNVIDNNNEYLGGKFVEIFKINGEDRHPFLHRHTLTDEFGAYSFSNIPDGQYKIMIHSGYGMPIFYPGTTSFDEAGVVSVNGTSITNVNIIIPGSMYVNLSGFVKEANTSIALANIRVAVDLFGACQQGTPQDSLYFSGYETLTDVNGYYSLQVPFGNYALVAYTNNGTYRTQYYDHVNLPFMANMIHAFSDMSDLNFDLIPQTNNMNNSISGTVTINGDVPGLPVMVVAVSSDEDWDETVVANQSGHYTIPIVNPGNYIVAVISPEAPPTYYQNSVSWDDAQLVGINGNVTDVDFNIEIAQTDGPFTVGGVVNVNNAESSANVSVILKNTQGQIVAFARTDQDGSYNISNIPSDDYEVIVTNLGLNTLAENINIVGNTSLNYTVNSATSQDNQTLINNAEFKLNNYPNPFNPQTNISFELNKDSQVNVEIYNCKGQKVIILSKGFMHKGINNIVWNGLDDTGNKCASGIYFCKVKGEGFKATKKMLLMK